MNFCVSMWSMSHCISSIQRNTRVLLMTMCRYDRRIFGKTSSLSFLKSGSLCGIHSMNSSRLIFLKRSPQCGTTSLPLVFASVSPKAEVWVKIFLVDVLMTGSSLGENSSYFAAVGEKPSPTFGSFSFSSFRDFLVVGFLGGIVPAIETNCLETTYRETLDKIHIWRVSTKI